MSIAMRAAQEATDGGPQQSSRYAECALRLLQAAIGDPMTLGEAQKLLEHWTLIGTPLEESFSRAILDIKTRRLELGDATLGEGVS